MVFSIVKIRNIPPQHIQARASARRPSPKCKKLATDERNARNRNTTQTKTTPPQLEKSGILAKPVHIYRHVQKKLKTRFL